VNLWGNGSSPMLISIRRKRVPIERSILACSPLTAPHSDPDLAIGPNQRAKSLFLVKGVDCERVGRSGGFLAFMMRVSASDSRLPPRS
jgi:hypothetical protein